MKKTIVFILVMLLCFASLPSLPVYAETVMLNQNGVPSKWAQSDLSFLAKYGVLEQRIFKTYQDPITRLDFIYLAVKLYEAATGEEIVIDPKIKFTDTNDIYVLKGTTVGITSGLGDGKFGPDVKITREQLATMMVKTFELSGKNLTESAFRFTDDQKISGYAKTSIYKAYNHNIINGYKNAVDPKGNATIEQALLIFKSSYDSFEKTLLSPSQIAKNAGNAVVHIETFDKSGQPIATGSGFAVEASGKIVTNYHVIQRAYSAKVKTLDGKVYPVLHVLGYDADRDVAVLKINGTNMDTLDMGNSENVLQGEEILTLGSPIGLENTISNGLVSNKNRVIDGYAYIQISAPISHGSSGGALLNYYGEVVGVTTAMYESGQNINLAIPINEVKPFLSVSTATTLETLATLKTYGSYNFDNGDTYSGEFLGGLMHGTGHYRWATGGSYTGEFFEDQFHGQGVLRLEDGSYVKGIWNHDVYTENLMVPSVYTSKSIKPTTFDLDIGWNEIENASHYYVYYAISPDGPWYYKTDAFGDIEEVYYTNEYPIALKNLPLDTILYIAVTSVVFDVESAPSEIRVVEVPK